MRRSTAVIYVVVLLTTMVILSTYSIYRVNNEYLVLDVTYDWHKRTGISTSFIDEYDTYVIRRPVTLERLDAAAGEFQVYGYPFWLDVSNWSEGQSVVIGGLSYEITREFQNWIAHRGYSDYYTGLYYHRELGLLVGIYIDTIDQGSYGNSGYSISVSLGANNIDELASYISGRYLIYDNLLIIGIFAELAIIDWLVTKRKNSKRPGTESSDSNPTPNSLSVLK